MYNIVFPTADLLSDLSQPSFSQVKLKQAAYKRLTSEPNLEIAYPEAAFFSTARCGFREVECSASPGDSQTLLARHMEP